MKSYHDICNVANEVLTYLEVKGFLAEFQDSKLEDTIQYFLPYQEMYLEKLPNLHGGIHLEKIGKHKYHIYQSSYDGICATLRKEDGTISNIMNAKVLAKFDIELDTIKQLRKFFAKFTKDSLAESKIAQNVKGRITVSLKEWGNGKAYQYLEKIGKAF